MAYPIDYGIDELTWITRQQYNQRKLKGQDAYTIGELMDGSVLGTEFGHIYVYNDRGGYVGGETYDATP